MDLGLFPFAQLPLPRLSRKPAAINRDDRFEVIVVGAGPSGLLLTFLLARYGLTAESVLCIDNKPTRVRNGHADGLQPRTLEVLRSLGLAGQILDDGRHLYEFAIWEPSVAGIIQRSSLAPTKTTTARYPHVVTIHQGKVEQVLEAGLIQYSSSGVQRRTKFIDAYFDPAGDPEFPVVAKVELDGVFRTLRTKYLVGADGAHSAVRHAFGLTLEGHSGDEVWGALDLVVDTDFPDIRRRSLVKSRNGTVLVIPRERNESGEYLTRLYVCMPHGAGGFDDCGKRKPLLRDKISLSAVFDQACRIFSPYRIAPKGNVEWWSCYRIGQRILEQFIVSDADGKGRVFFVGDACHTHSPKAGQGMNVSMMDAYNLGWKLSYTVMGLCSSPKEDPDALMKTYHTERFPVAQQLIQFDQEYAAKFAASREKSLCEDNLSSRADDIVGCHREANAFSSGCGIEYPESIITRNSEWGVSSRSVQCPFSPGTRLPNVRLKRYADGACCDMHDEMLSNGRFRVLCLTSSDLLSPYGASRRALQYICETVLPQFPRDLIELFIVYPSDQSPPGWAIFPQSVKNYSEMRLFDGMAVEDAYGLYGVDTNRGAVIVLRPDGYIGMEVSLKDLLALKDYLESCLAPIQR